MVPAPAGRHDQVRREPAEEVSGHLPDQLRVGRLASAVGRAEARHRVLDRPRRDDLPRRQPAHQAVPLLGVGARRDQARRIPEAIFLSEAFTRPKVMRHLAKAGFSQSYTYFTWRNTAQELTEYFTELDPDRRPRVPASESLRQHAGHPARVPAARRDGRPSIARFVLAATLGASYGIYSGFELAENVPVRPGSEEYLDSEKYQIKVRDFARADSLSELIAQVNQIRRDHPALQRDWGLRSIPPTIPELLCYSKRSEDGRDLLLMVVNLDPFHMQHGHVELPLAAWQLSPDSAVHVTDLLSERAVSLARKPQLRPARPRGPRGAHPACTAGSGAAARTVGGELTRAWPKRRILSGTRTPSSIRCTSARFSTAPTTASATSRG